jgi:predicted PurR-regulated permease PerM
MTADPAASLPPTEYQPQRRARLLIGVLGVAVAYAVLPYLPGLLGAAVLHVIGAPAYRRLARHLPPRVAAVLVTVGMTVLILLPVAWLAGVVLGEAPDTLRRLQEGDFVARLRTLRIGPFEVGAELARVSGALISWLSGQAFGFFGSATRGILNIFLALFGLYYMLLSADSLWERFRRYLPFSDENREILRARFHSVTEAMLLGILLVAALQGSIVGFGFYLVGLPNALFWGGITACVSVLPVLGSAIVWVPGVLVLLAQQRVGAAIALAAISLLLATNVDNIFRPIVYRRVSNVHPMITLVGAFAGVSLFGLVGLLLGPLAILYFFELLRMYDEEYGYRHRALAADPSSAIPAPTAAPVAPPVATPRPAPVAHPTEHR